MRFVYLIIPYIALSFFKVKYFIKEKKKRELVFFSIVITIAFTLTLLFSMNIEVPSVDKLVGDLIMSNTGG